MKKSKIKWAIRQGMKHYYKSGLTSTAGVVEKLIHQELEKAYKKKKKR
jgi:hypothetical protein